MITNIWQKFFASVINAGIVFAISSPVWWNNFDLDLKKTIVIAVFFLYTLIFLIFNENRDFGMIVIGTKWKKKYKWWQYLVFDLIYTASFATLLFWFYFPFDLFLANIIILQLPMIFFTGYTFHGFIAGKMITVKAK